MSIDRLSSCGQRQMFNGYGRNSGELTMSTDCDSNKASVSLRANVLDNY